MTAIATRPSRSCRNWRSFRPALHGALGGLVLMAILGCGAGSACGAGTGEARGAGLSGVFLVCKEYGTVRGTFLTNVRGRDITRLNYLFGEGVDPRLSPSDERVLFT